MGAYFKCTKRDGIVQKTLIRKEGGSEYPTFEEFSSKIDTLKKYMGDFVLDSRVEYLGNRIRIVQPEFKGSDLFGFLKVKKPKDFDRFLLLMNQMHLEAGMLPDMLNIGNILVNGDGEIKIVDIWPLFFSERIDNGDITAESYKENLQKFDFLKSFRSLP